MDQTNYNISILKLTYITIISLFFTGCSNISYNNLTADSIQDFKMASPLLPKKAQIMPQTDASLYSYTWDKEISIKDDIKVRLQYKGPIGQALHLKYSDEDTKRTIWKYIDYSSISEIRISDNKDLFYVVDELFPFPSDLKGNPVRRRYLYVYDLNARRKVGHIKIDCNKYAENELPF